MSDNLEIYGSNTQRAMFLLAQVAELKQSYREAQTQLERNMITQTAAGLLQKLVSDGKRYKRDLNRYSRGMITRQKFLSRWLGWSYLKYTKLDFAKPDFHIQPLLFKDDFQEYVVNGQKLVAFGAFSYV